MTVDMHKANPKMSAKEITIKLDSINVEDSLYMLRFLSQKNKTLLHLYFRNTLFFPFSEDDELRKKQFQAVPYLVKLIKLSEKFNQRDGWWLDDRSLLTHDRNPINNVSTKLIVKDGEIKIINEAKISGHSYLEFAVGDKYEGNAEYFAKTYKEDILKAAILLEPITWDRRNYQDLRQNYNLKRVLV